MAPALGLQLGIGLSNFQYDFVSNPLFIHIGTLFVSSVKSVFSGTFFNLSNKSNPITGIASLAGKPVWNLLTNLSIPIHSPIWYSGIGGYLVLTQTNWVLSTIITIN
jgi:hypothetical protein